MISPKDEVKKIVEQALGNARDNLYRATFTFRGQDMAETHGYSGKTKGEIVTAYQREVESMQTCLDWVNSHD